MVIVDNTNIQEQTKEQFNQKVQSINISESSSHHYLNLKLDNDTTLSFEFENDRVQITFDKSYFKLLRRTINNNSNAFVKLANLYNEKTRDFHTFLYDLIILIYFTSKLPNKFQQLLERQELTSEGDLMHNRILAQTAFYLRTKHTVTLNQKAKKRPSPDLTVDNFFVDIKTINSRYYLDQRSLEKFVKVIEEKYNKAMKQTDNGIVFISFWSKNMNALFQDYFHGLYTTQPYPLKKNSCYFILDGRKTLEDFYTKRDVYDFKNVLPRSMFIDKSGQMNCPSYHSILPISRNGFPILMRGSPHHWGVSWSFG